MGSEKVVFKYFTLFQYRQEEEYLSLMHEKGWKLKKITFPGFYHFEKCEPGKAAYRLDYNQEGVKNKAEYVQMFSDCGWEYLFDFVGYSYFCKEGNTCQGSEEIFCDDASRLDMIKRVFKGRMIPLIIVFVCIALPQFILNMIGYDAKSGPRSALSVFWLVLVFLNLFLFSVTAFQLYQFEGRVTPDGTKVKFKYCGIAALILLIAAGIGAFFYFSGRSVYSVSEREDGFTIDAEWLNTGVEMEYDLREGDVIAVSHDYEGGEIFIRVGEEGKDPVFFGNSYGEMGDFTLEIQEDGRYKIECSGRRAKGVIEFVINGY